MTTVVPVPSEAAPWDQGGPDHNGPGVPGRWRRVLVRHWAAIALTVIVVAGAALRLIAIGWGLPLQLHPDEAVIVNGALDMAHRHSFEPPFYFRPDHLEMELANLAYLAYSYLLHHSSPTVLDATSGAPFYLIARLITACWGIAMIVVAYLIGARFHRAIGLISAFLIAFFPPFVINSHFASPDVPLSVAFMIVILGCMRYLSAPTWRHVLLPSLGVSIAVAIKYPGALGTIMIAVTVIMSSVRDRAWHRIAGHGAVAIAAVIGFLFLISPVLFTNAQFVITSMSQEAGGDHLGAGNLGLVGRFAFYAAGFATAGGIALVAFFLLGVFFSVRLRLGQAVPLGMGAIFWVLLSTLPLHWDRWALPMYLTPLLIAPIGIYYSARFLREAGTARWLRWVAVVATSLMALNLIITSVAVTAQFAATNTQNAGLADFVARGVTKANTEYEGYTPLHPGGPRMVFDQFEVVDGRLLLRPRDVGRAKMRYVTVSSDMYGRYNADPGAVRQQQFYRLLAEQYPLLAVYRPIPLGDWANGTPGLGTELPFHATAPTVFATVGILRSAAYLAAVARGGMSGPTIELYGIPADRR